MGQKYPLLLYKKNLFKMNDYFVKIFISIHKSSYKPYLYFGQLFVYIQIADKFSFNELNKKNVRFPNLRKKRKFQTLSVNEKHSRKNQEAPKNFFHTSARKKVKNA